MVQYHEVKINIDFERIENLLKFGPTTLGGSGGVSGDIDASLWVDYIFLDTDERKDCLRSRATCLASVTKSHKLRKPFLVASGRAGVILNTSLLRNTLLFENILLQLAPPSLCVKTHRWLREKLRYGNRRSRRDNSHAYDLKALCQAYGRASETERVLDRAAKRSMGFCPTRRDNG